jgi:hypothetical protein
MMIQGFYEVGVQLSDGVAAQRVVAASAFAQFSRFAFPDSAHFPGSAYAQYCSSKPREVSPRSNLPGFACSTCSSPCSSCATLTSHQLRGSLRSSPRSFTSQRSRADNPSLLILGKSNEFRPLPESARLVPSPLPLPCLTASPLATPRGLTSRPLPCSPLPCPSSHHLEISPRAVPRKP